MYAFYVKVKFIFYVEDLVAIATLVTQEYF